MVVMLMMGVGFSYARLLVPPRGGGKKKEKKKRASRGLVRSIGCHVTLLSVNNTDSWKDRIKPGHEKILPRLPQSFVALVFSAARPLLPSSLPLQLHPVFRCFSKQVPEEKEMVQFYAKACLGSWTEQAAALDQIVSGSQKKTIKNGEAIHALAATEDVRIPHIVIQL